MKRVSIIRLLSLLWLTSCIEPYYPPPGTGEGGLLVIDGFINATDRSASITLSRGIALDDSHTVPPELNASVTITSSSGMEYRLTEEEGENSAGIYTATNLLLNPSDTYTLHVITASGGSYSSDEVELLDSPILDSVSWRPDATGVNFFVSAHDPDNKTRYYRWKFVETFEYNAPLVSYFKKVNGLPEPRGSGEFVYFCWGSYNSTGIMVNSTTHLSDDVVSMFPIYFIPKGSRKLGLRYRLLVQQRAISQDEFEFWQLMRKTTETMGSLFDPMPSQVIGNVHSDDNINEYVLGYFSGGYVDEIKKDINHLTLPADLRVVDPYDFNCEGRLVYLEQLNTVDVNEVYLNTFGFPFVQGYVVVPRICADCRSLFNGTNVMPDDWPIL